MIDYRHGRPADADALAAMAGQCFTETFGHLYPPHDLAAFLEQTFGPSGLPAQIGDSRFSIRVATEDERIVGFAKIGPNAFLDHAPPDAVELYQLYILKAWQGAGIADALMDWVIEQGRAAGAPQLVLSVFTENPRAIRFYERRGWRIVGRYHFAVGETVDEDHVMVFDL